MSGQLNLETMAAFARVHSDNAEVPGEFDDFEVVFQLLVRGVRIYAAEWERRDLARVERNLDVAPEDREPRNLADLTDDTRVGMTLGAIRDNLE